MPRFLKIYSRKLRTSLLDTDLGLDWLRRFFYLFLNKWIIEILLWQNATQF